MPGAMPVLLGKVREQRVDVAHGKVLQLLEAVLLRGVDDAGDHVVAALHLAVVRRRGADDMAVRHVHEVHDHGGGADVHGRAVARLRGVAREDVEHLEHVAVR